jgi:signal transduction histidine kinase/phage shock protein PspC (stress-responsive transcriptional regulator)
VSAATPTSTPLRRDPDHGVVAGVCAGIAERVGIDPILLRIGFVIATIATAGAAALGYALAWLLIPAKGATGASERTARPPRVRRGGWRVAAGAGLLALSALLVFRELGIWWSDALVWPLVLATAGAALLWRQSRAMQPSAVSTQQPGVSPPTAAPRRAGPADLYRGGFGIALVVGAALLFLSANDALGATRDAVLAILVGVMALALILAPFLWRLGRNLATERAERIRSQERAELAAHLHDSVLQTLTLMQKRAGNPREVATLARRQERELRAWLFDGRRQDTEQSLAAAIEAAAAEVEDAHGWAIDVVTVGDRRLDERGEALVAATREALTNAAKFAGPAGTIAVYAEMGAERAQVFVRDRGAGFDPASIPAERHGLRESIVGRMERNGGRATIRSSPGTGTEIELTIEMEAA